MYYWIFFRTGLVPRWLSGWGLAGVILGFTAAMLVLFRVTGYMSALQVLLNVPIGVNEMVLAVWLIVRGFRFAALFPGRRSAAPMSRERRRRRRLWPEVPAIGALRPILNPVLISG